jgi:3-oxocholest-4-en-26-oyl-CoA dehydrogenase beta subunit
MDFSFTEEQTALSRLARRLFEELAPPASQEPDGLHEPLWKELSRSELLGLALPAEVGGGGLGFIELMLLIERAGYAGSTAPLLPTLVLGALPIAELGSEEQKARWLRPVVAGDELLSAALVEVGAPVRASSEGGWFRLDGVRECVPALPLAARVLVPAETSSGQIGIFVVDTKAKGVRVERQMATNGEPLGRLELSGVSVEARDVLVAPEPGRERLEWMLDHARVGMAALALGAATRALELTAKYASERQQFDRPIGTFQAVSQRVADAYIDVEIMRLTLWRAAWLLDQKRPARAEAAVAKFWAAEAGHRVVNAAQHVHGGIGFDRDYPVYRHFLAERQIEFTLGSATSELSRLGALMARETAS